MVKGLYPPNFVYIVRFKRKCGLSECGLNAADCSGKK
jgi:hypothetical protein